MRSMVVLAALVGVAHADEVNLLTHAPSTIAVSSTVANAAIVPDHIADGKLATAWNSKTGELVGAWVAVRLPADAKVKSIKLTAGFAHKDRRGDLFTMNPRIKKVRVSHNGKPIGDHVLDIANRGLQAIPVAVTGGDLEIRVLEIAPGTKPAWKEACISELEVWGEVPKPAKAKPKFRVGGLDSAPTLTREQCIKALFPDARAGRIGADKTDDKITGVTVTPVTEQYVVCSVDHSDGTTITHAYAAVKRAPRPFVVGEIETSTTENEDTTDQDGMSTSGKIEVALVPLTLSEQGVLVHVTQRKGGPMTDDRETESTLYRVSAKGLVEILAWKSTWSGGEADRGDECELQPPKLGKWMPSTLVLECTESTGDYHNEDIDKRGLHTEQRDERYVWKNGRYEKK